MTEIIKAKGSPTQIGKTVGLQAKEQIEVFMDLTRKSPPVGLSWEKTVDKSKSYFDVTNCHFPHIIKEMKATAIAAEQDPKEFFAAFVEELWDLGHPKNCTDIIIGDSIGHNNDLPPSLAPALTIVDKELESGLHILSIGLAGLTSVGINSRKIALTGSQLYPTDNKTGIPRSILAMAMLYAESFTAAKDIILNTNRASSYCNIISTPNPNEIIAFEGSATDHKAIRPNKGKLVHANNYITKHMRKYEGKPDYPSSQTRYERAKQLVHNTTADIKAILRDHGPNNQPSDNTICRHGENSMTLFGFIVDFRNNKIEYAAGNPCQTEFQTIWQLK